jgi:hypothetical protein
VRGYDIILDWLLQVGEAAEEGLRFFRIASGSQCGLQA